MSSFIDFILMINNLKIVAKELLGLLDLFRAQILYIHELTEVVMISKHKNFLLIAL